jgi:hypothetical protein
MSLSVSDKVCFGVDPPLKTRINIKRVFIYVISNSFFIEYNIIVWIIMKNEDTLPL